MGILHVYDEVVATRNVDDRPAILLGDGTCILLPQISWKDVDRLVAGDLVLLDLQGWKPDGGMAMLYVFRNRSLLFCFSMGHSCDIQSPVLLRE